MASGLNLAPALALALALVAPALSAQVEMRRLNLGCERLKAAELKALDSSLKKNQAFIKKCATLGEASKASLLLPTLTSPEPLAPSLSLTPGQASLLQEMSKLNLSRFVEEVRLRLSVNPKPKP